MYSSPPMFAKRLACTVLFLLPLALAVDEFVFNGFNGSSLVLDGSATIMQNGLLTLTSASFGGARASFGGARASFGGAHAFFPSPFQMRNLSDGSVFSFSATFVFAISPSRSFPDPNVPMSLNGGIAFVLAPTRNFGTASGAILDRYNNGKPSNHLLAVELDTCHDQLFDDIDDNHVGIDVNSLNSSASSPAGYYTDDPFSDLHPLQLSNGKELQAWIEYDPRLMQLNVTLAPVPMPKPKRPLLSSTVDLSSVLLDRMFVGFSSSFRRSRYYYTRYYDIIDHYNFVMDCSFKLNEEAAPLNYSKLPGTDVNVTNDSRYGGLRPFYDGSGTSYYVFDPEFLKYVGIVLGSMLAPIVVYLGVRRWHKYRELREDWEMEFGPHRFSYKELFKATDGFKEKQLLGVGGFGKVYKGVLLSSKLEVAVKVMSHESKQGMKEFIAEVVSIGRLRHRNLVQLLGYCRRKGELLLVYEYLSNGSLDRYLYDQEKPSLDWAHRFEIIKGVASGLFYLHEEWEQVVIHRDVKASNVLLDGEMNGRLGDFGLARLHDHGIEAHTTCVAGTRGYISPELARIGKATKATDVYAFGAFILEVACGRRPIGVNSRGEPQVLVDFVLRFWQRDLIVCMMDPRLGGEYVADEAEMVLKLGLLCSHLSPAGRPSMRLVMQYLSGDAPFPEMPDSYLSIRSFNEMQSERGFDDEDDVQYPSVQTSIGSLSISGGR